MDKDKLVLGTTEIAHGEQKMVQISVGRLPSDTRININIHVFRAKKPGPTALLLGGVHGDEINGVETIRRCIDDGLFKRIECGTVIAIPLLNVYGFINFSRDVPDGKDVNRSFPGVSSGSLASRVARVLTKKILTQVDFAIDFHTGGASRYNHPQIRYSPSHEGAFDLAKQFASPMIIQKALIANSFRKSAKDMGIPAIVFEGGESVRLDGFAIEKAIQGLKRVLLAQKMIKMNKSAAKPIIHIKKSSWIRASHAGLFQWTQSSGSFVRKSEPIGMIYGIQGDKKTIVSSTRSGYIVSHNNASVVNVGDALFSIGYDHENI